MKHDSTKYLDLRLNRAFQNVQCDCEVINVNFFYFVLCSFTEFVSLINTMTELIDILFGTVTKTSLLIIIHLDLSLSVSNLVSVSLTKMISDRSGPGFVCL